MGIKMTATVFSGHDSDELLSSGKGLRREPQKISFEIPHFTDEQIAAMDPKKRRQYFDQDYLD